MALTPVSLNAVTRRMHAHTLNPHTQVLDKYEDIKLGELHGIDAKKVGRFAGG